ncbi:MAG: UDP-N-acetyl glucosamine 2-epimerase [Bacteroidales bacterium]
MKKVISFTSTNQNLLKITSVDKAFKKYRKEVKHLICQIAYEEESKFSMAKYHDLDFPKIHHTISVKDGSNASQTGQTMLEVEKVLSEENPDLVILSGDQDTILSVAITASKMKIPIANIDAGLRCFDQNDAAETNRILIDVLCEYNFISEHSAMKNLRDSGKDNDYIFFTGNPLIDVLELYWSDMEESSITEKLKTDEKGYLLICLHKKESSLFRENLSDLSDMIDRLHTKIRIIWIIPPGLQTSIHQLLPEKLIKSISLIDPPGYIDFLSLLNNAEAVITDSETIQEETTYLSCQCITLRKYTERIVTLDVGTNQLVGYDLEKAEKAAEDIIKGMIKPGRMPEMWDGKSGKRIVENLMEEMDTTDGQE